MSQAAVPSRETVEQVVRGQLATALGGRRGMLEGAVPTLLFTIIYLATRDDLGSRGLHLALAVSVASAVALLVVRLVQRSTVQYCLNALFGIAIGAAFALFAGSRGGSADDQALAYFLPGIVYNAGYTLVLGLSALASWPLVGFMIGSVTGDATAWRRDRQVVALCSRLTWLLALPCALRVAAQAPLWLGARAEALDKDRAIALLGVLKVAMGWPLTLVAVAAMVWLLNRDRTPVADPASVHEALDVSASEG